MSDVPPVVGVYEEALDYWATWSHVFQNPNLIWLPFDTREIVGNFFLGLQAQTANAWDTQIPPGSKVLSATMEFTPDPSNANPAFTAIMNTNQRGLGGYAHDPVQKPFEPFLQWRRDAWSNQSLAILSTTFTAIAGPATAPANQQWILKQFTSLGATVATHDKFGQRVTVRPGTNQEVSFIAYEGFRTGNPVGDIRCRIQGFITDRGVTIPDGIDLGVSTILASSVPLGPAVGSLAFFFAAGIFLTVGQDYFIILESDYPQSQTDHIVIRHQNQFLTDGQLYHYGEGLGADWQNYPGIVDLQLALASGNGTTDVIWPINSVVVNVTEVSPDITDLVQFQIDQANYTIDSGIMINLSQADPADQSRRFRSNTNLGGAGPILRVTYTHGDVGEGKADSYRFHDKVTDQIYREDEDLIMIGQGAVELFNRH